MRRSFPIHRMPKLYSNELGSHGFGQPFLTMQHGIPSETAANAMGALLNWAGVQSELDARSDDDVRLQWCRQGAGRLPHSLPLFVAQGNRDPRITNSETEQILTRLR